MTQEEAVELLVSLEKCGRLGKHEETDCASERTRVTSKHRNHHRKYLGLLEFQPRMLWIVGPDAFIGDPDLVFTANVLNGGKIDLARVDASALHFRG